MLTILNNRVPSYTFQGMSTLVDERHSPELVVTEAHDGYSHRYSGIPCVNATPSYRYGWLLADMELCEEWMDPNDQYAYVIQ